MPKKQTHSAISNNLHGIARISLLVTRYLFISQFAARGLFISHLVLRYSLLVTYALSSVALTTNNLYAENYPINTEGILCI
ncbi:hypothetical protein ACSSVW_004049 [Pseudoalteromonas sp. MBR-15]|jgi:hypothetical protein